MNETAIAAGRPTAKRFQGFPTVASCCVRHVPLRSVSEGCPLCSRTEVQCPSKFGYAFLCHASCCPLIQVVGKFTFAPLLCIISLLQFCWFLREHHAFHVRCRLICWDGRNGFLAHCKFVNFSWNSPGCEPTLAEGGALSAVCASATIYMYMQSIEL